MIKINCKFLDNMLLKSVHNVSFSNWKLFDIRYFWTPIFLTY